MIIAGIGNDIIDLERVKHVRRFSTRAVLRILTRSEQIKYRKSHAKTELWGRFFSAKEAAFKSLGLTMFGPGGFRLIDVHFMNKQMAVATLRGALRKKTRLRASRIYLSSIRLDQYIISQAIRIK